MRLALKLSVAFCVAASPMLATPRAPRIAGTVYEDHAALAMRTVFTRVRGVSIVLYRDDGDRRPSVDDGRIATTATDSAGAYVFDVEAGGDYWIVVDSQTFGPRGAWAEQTFGPAGALCAQPDGAARRNFFEGPCFGGRTADRPDDARALESSEHLALVEANAPATGIDFAFSFDVVTSTGDADRIQGSLRQFVVNANAIPGANRMRFVPLAPAPEQRQTSMGVPPRWWSITLAAPLPELTDENTTLDGAPYNFLSPASALNVHFGRLGDRASMRLSDSLIPRLEKPELELIFTGRAGIVCDARCGLRALAIQGASSALVVRDYARIEDLLIGASPDGQPVQTMGEIGLHVEGGITVARHVLITMQSNAGVVVGRDARLDAEHLDISRCGGAQAGAGIVLLSHGSSIRSSMIVANLGAGIIIGSVDHDVSASGNTIDGCTISENQAGVILGPRSSRNVITRNDMMWNRFGAVTFAPHRSAPPRENRISANRFNENGLRPIILGVAAGDPEALSRGTGTCERTAGAPNDGITAPRLASVRIVEEGETARIIIRGNACAGHVVEIYQSFVTSEVREEPELARVRSDKIEKTTIEPKQATALPSIGEFNYLGALNTAADGSFEATFSFPLPVANPTRNDVDPSPLGARILPSDPAGRAFSALAIDAAGNTSEMSTRRAAD